MTIDNYKFAGKKAIVRVDFTSEVTSRKPCVCTKPS